MQYTPVYRNTAILQIWAFCSFKAGVTLWGIDLLLVSLLW